MKMWVVKNFFFTSLFSIYFPADFDLEKHFSKKINETRTT